MHIDSTLKQKEHGMGQWGFTGSHVRNWKLPQSGVALPTNIHVHVAAENQKL